MTSDKSKCLWQTLDLLTEHFEWWCKRHQINNPDNLPADELLFKLTFESVHKTQATRELISWLKTFVETWHFVEDLINEN